MPECLNAWLLALRDECKMMAVMRGSGSTGLEGVI
jgi:hypothetical protein